MPTFDLECPACATIHRDVFAKFQDVIPCPKCGGPTTRVLCAPSFTPDDIPGGVWLENYGPDPVKVYSHTERRRLMNCCVDRKGRPYRLTEIGSAGGGSPLTREGLEAARILVERAGRAPTNPRDAEQADRDFRDPAVQEFAEARGSDEAIAAQQFKLDRDQR